MPKKEYEEVFGKDPVEGFVKLIKGASKVALWGSAGIIALGLGLNVFEALDSQNNERI